jgi:hypothetical protein
MTKMPSQTPGGKKTAASPRQTPLEAIRGHCFDFCGSSPKSALWCCCSYCRLWIFRFGRRPESMAPELVTPALFIGPDVNEDDLPNGTEAAAAFLAERQAAGGPDDG